MDKERARFILGCFRPDGADAVDPDFAAALRLAAEDRELGEWLARERACDGAFAAALSGVGIPVELRDAILAGLAAERGDLPQAEDAIDESFIGALASLRPPERLRDQILVAMERSAVKRRRAASFWKFGVPLAAAAAIALGLFMARDHSGERHSSVLPVAAVEAGFLRAFESPSFRLDMTDANHQALYAHLKSRSLPCPCPRGMPPGLAEVEGVGCRVLEVDGRKGSLVCFDERRAGTVHLVVFQRQDVDDLGLPGVRAPQLEQHGRWAVARWANEDAVFLLMGNTDVERLAGLF